MEPERTVEPGRLVITSGDCESCGDGERDDLVTVHRLYVTPPARDADPGTEPEVIRVATAERWCAACRVHYPHEIADQPTA